MTAVDLTFARARARDRVLLDRVTISRNPEGKRDSEFDAETGTFVIPDPEDEISTLADDVPALARANGTTDVSIGGETVTARRWTVKLGYDEAPEGIAFGDMVTFTTSEDADLQGTVLFVNDVTLKTLRVFREVECVRLVDGTERR